MEKINHVIKNKKGSYFTAKGGWSKDIYKAELIGKEIADWKMEEWPAFFSNSKLVTIRETHLREEV